MNSAVKLRLAEPADAEAVADIWYHGWQDGHLGNVPEELVSTRTEDTFRTRAEVRVRDGVCPACGSVPVSSMVVGWPKANNTRFCACSLCATMWNVVRVKCVLCSSTEGINFKVIEGKPDTVKAETCDTCRSYVKILYQVNDALLESVADDVATLGLDMMLAEEGWKRGAHNPFLLGY